MKSHLFAVHHLGAAAEMTLRQVGVASFLRSGAAYRPQADDIRRVGACRLRVNGTLQAEARIAVIAAQTPLGTDGRILADTAAGILVEILDRFLVLLADGGTLQAASYLPDGTVFLRRAAVL